MASVQDVNLWVASRFGLTRRGRPTATMIEGFNKAHPDNPYTGPAHNASSWSRVQGMTRYQLNAKQREHIERGDE